MEKIDEPAILVVKSVILGKGYLSGMVTLFNRQLSPQGLQTPPFFLTMWRGDDQGDEDDTSFLHGGELFLGSRELLWVKATRFSID